MCAAQHDPIDRLAQIRRKLLGQICLHCAPSQFPALDKLHQPFARQADDLRLIVKLTLECLKFLLPDGHGRRHDEDPAAGVFLHRGLERGLGARVGIFNVGGEGQLLLGAIFAAQVGVWMDGQPRFLVIICAALAAMAVGGLYAFLPGVLKVKVKVNEVITTIMLNTIAAYLCQYLAKGPWKNANKNMVAATEQLGAQYWFGNVIPRSNLTSAVFAAAVMAFLVWYVMERTSVGYEMRITGENPRFAFFSGLRTDQIVLLSMVVSGAMCGLVGMFRVYGVEHLYRDSVSKDYYFEALMVAMIAQYKPVTVILLSLFFAVLKIGAQGMELIGIPSQIYLIIQTVIIFCMAAESGITRSLTAAHERRRAKRAAEERLKEELKHG